MPKTTGLRGISLATYPVIMCGGSGTRLWPASRPSRPKQFIPLLGPLSSFQQTVLRLAGVENAAAPVIVAAPSTMEPAALVAVT